MIFDFISYFDKTDFSPPTKITETFKFDSEFRGIAMPEEWDQQQKHVLMRLYHIDWVLGVRTKIQLEILTSEQEKKMDFNQVAADPFVVRMTHRSKKNAEFWMILSFYFSPSY